MAIIDQNLKLLEELDLKLKPDGGRLPIAEEGALKVNGIDLRKHLEDPETITYSEAKTKIVAVLKKYLKKNGRHSNIRGMGYNYDFDESFINEYLIPTDEWNSLINYNSVDPKIVVNFLKDANWLPQELGSLVSVVKYFNIPMGTAHTAKADTLAMVEAYKKLLELMASRKDGGTSLDLLSLLEAE